MKIQEKKSAALLRRHRSIRKKVVGSTERPRLMVFRSNNHTYAQIIDDSTGNVLAAASTLTADIRSNVKSPGNVQAAQAVGKHVASLALSRGISQVCFDRGGRKYHGRVKALADAAREAGLVF